VIIVCKGTRKNNKFEKCEFIHIGSWGDSKLFQHERFHRSQEESNYFWLGFDVSQSLGNFSNRDGKRS